MKNKTGIPPDCQQLTFNGRVLKDQRTLNDCDIKDWSTFDLNLTKGSKLCVTRAKKVVYY